MKFLLIDFMFFNYKWCYIWVFNLSVYLVILNGKIDNINFLLRNFVSQRDIFKK